jgi:hypothetical protein
MNHPITTTPPDVAARNTAARTLACATVTRLDRLPHSPHEGYAKILERLDDLRAEVFHGGRSRARQDAIRVAAAAMALLLTLAERLDLGDVAQAVTAELERAQRRFGPYVSPHEGYAVILEEADELWDEVKRGDVVKQDIWDEGVQVAAVALRFHVDIQEGDELARRREDEWYPPTGVPVRDHPEEVNDGSV